MIEYSFIVYIMYAFAASAVNNANPSIHTYGIAESEYLYSTTKAHHCSKLLPMPTIDQIASAVHMYIYAFSMID